MSVIDLTKNELMIHEQIKNKLDELGVSESELCRRAKVDRQVMFRLSQKDGKQVTHLRQILTALSEIENELKEKTDECK